MVFNSVVSSSTADKKSRIWKPGLGSGVVVSREGKLRNMAIWAIAVAAEPIRNRSPNTIVGAYDFVTPVPQFLARSRLEASSNMHKFVVKVLDGRVLLIGVVGRRVQRSVKNDDVGKEGKSQRKVRFGFLYRNTGPHTDSWCWKTLHNAGYLPHRVRQYTQGLYGIGPGLRG